MPYNPENLNLKPEFEDIFGKIRELKQNCEMQSYWVYLQHQYSMLLKALALSVDYYNALKYSIFKLSEEAESEEELKKGLEEELKKELKNEE